VSSVDITWHTLNVVSMYSHGYKAFVLKCIFYFILHEWVTVHLVQNWFFLSLCFTIYCNRSYSSSGLYFARLPSLWCASTTNKIHFFHYAYLYHLFVCQKLFIHYIITILIFSQLFYVIFTKIRFKPNSFIVLVFCVSGGWIYSFIFFSSWAASRLKITPACELLHPKLYCLFS